jgi:acyl-CoA reductase-like NAD-dependent aldehyde dehydrogenase
MDVINPANGKLVATVPCADEADVDLAVEAALKAFPGWRATYVGDRVDLIMKLAAKMREHADELAVLETSQYGGPISKTRAFDVNAAPAIWSMSPVSPAALPATPSAPIPMPES